jgi:defect-in-organelle-trafficking protein DotB
VLRATKRSLDLKAVERTATKLFRAADAMAHLRTGQAFSVAYEPGETREYNAPVSDKRHRFRVNVANAQQWGNDGPTVIVRPLPTEPVPAERLDMEPVVLEHCRPDSGLVIFSGATGEGKSTTMASVVLRELQDPGAHVTIAEFGSPIEFVFDGKEGPSARISQYEIPRHLLTFSDAIHFAVRGNFKVIVVTECRDAETMVAAIRAAQTGHRVLLTLHGNSLFETFESAVSMCPVAIRQEMTTALAQAVRLVVNQRLVWSADGTRTPIREIMVCNPDIRRMLGQQEPKTWPLVMENMAKALRLDFGASLKRALDEGRITAAEFAKQIGKLRE